MLLSSLRLDCSDTSSSCVLTHSLTHSLVHSFTSFLNFILNVECDSYGSAAAKDAGAYFELVSPASCLSKYQGESERTIRNVFARAR